MNHPDTSVKSPKAASAQAADLAGLLGLRLGAAGGSAPRCGLAWLPCWWLRGRVCVAKQQGGQRRPQLCDGRGAPRQPHAQRGGQRHLQPTRSVTIGSELSGTVRNVLVDVNDKVKKGPGAGGAGHRQARSAGAALACIAGCRPGPAGAGRGTTKEATAGLARLQGSGAPVGRQVPSATELDAGQATLDRAKADEASARASVDDARAAPLPTKPISRRHRSVRPSTGGAHPQCGSPATPWLHRCKR